MSEERSSKDKTQKQSQPGAERGEAGASVEILHSDDFQVIEESQTEPDPGDPDVAELGEPESEEKRRPPLPARGTSAERGPSRNSAEASSNDSKAGTGRERHVASAPPDAG